LKGDIRIIFWFLRPYAFPAIAVCILLFVYSLLETISIGALYPFVNKILSGSGNALNYGGKVLIWIDSVSNYIPIHDKLIATSLFLLAIIIISNIFGFLSESFSLWFHLKLFADFQNKIYEKILYNHYLFFQEKNMVNSCI